MPVLDFSLYFNLLLFGLIGLGMLFGFIRGFRNSLYGFIVKLAFFAFFFLTINMVVNQLWTMTLPGVGDFVRLIDPSISNVSSLSGALPLLLESLLGDSLRDSVTNPELVAFTTGLALFIVKIVYTILYFSVVYVIYRLIFFIVKLIIFRKKEKTSRSRVFGMVVGGMNGALTVFVTLIILGGMISITSSLYSILDDTGTTTQTIEFSTMSENGNSTSVTAELDEQIKMLGEMVEGYENNVIVQVAELITISTDGVSPIPLNLYLFDSVFSFNYRETQISIRKELQIGAEVIGIVIQSGYLDNEDIAAIESQDVRDLFTQISRSDLVKTVIPIAIEVGSDYSDFDLDTLLEEQDIDLYAIDWGQEIEGLGLVAVVLVDIVAEANLLADDVEFEDVSFNGDLVEQLFVEFSESGLITLAAYTVTEPLLDNAGENMRAIITVPSNMKWEDEFLAIGSVLKEIVDSGVTLRDFQSDDSMQLFTLLSAIDFTVMKNSMLISHAMVNIIEGEGDLGSFDMIKTPDNIVWFNEDNLIDDDSELDLILQAFNIIAAMAADLDGFDEAIDLNIFSRLDSDDLDQVLTSEVLETTVGYLLIDMLGETLMIPTDATKEVIVKGETLQVVTGLEVKQIFDAIVVLDITDFNAIDFDIGILKSLSVDPENNSTELDEDKVNTLFASEIIHASISNVLLTQFAGDETSPIIVPHYNVSGSAIQWLDTEDNFQYISREEITKLLSAVLALDLDSFDEIGNLSFENIVDNIDIIVESTILHGTISDFLISGFADDDTLVVPHYQSVDNGSPVAIRFVVGEVENGEDKRTNYITKDEIVAFMNALDIIGITNMETTSTSFDLNAIFEEDGISALFDSAIMHATVSKQLMDSDDDQGGTFIIPDYTVETETTSSTALVFTVGEGIDEFGDSKETNYMLKSEIQAVINGLVYMGYADITDTSNTGLDSTLFFANREEVLKSSIIYATISDMLLNASGEMLKIPDYYLDGVTPIRQITTGGTIYIDSVELHGLFDGLETLGLTNFDNITIQPSNILDPAVDYQKVIEDSMTLHATISHVLLDTALDETAPSGQFNLIIPTSFRIGYTIDTVSQLRVEQDELIKLLSGIQVLSMDNFDDPVDAGVITNLSGPELDTILTSASLHTTVNNIFRGNQSIDIPNRITDDYYGITGYELIEQDEIKYFIQAVVTTQQDNFSNASFDLNTIQNLDASERAIVLNSMIIQKTLTPLVENAITLYQLQDPTYEPSPTYYHDNDPNTFFTGSGIENVLQEISL